MYRHNVYGRLWFNAIVINLYNKPLAIHEYLVIIHSDSYVFFRLWYLMG